MVTLERLEKKIWGEPNYGSHLVTACHALRKKDLGDFTPEDVRIMVGQGIGLKWLAPMALDLLEADVMAHGDFYPGDLLEALLRDRNWPEIEEYAARVTAIADKAIAKLDAEDERNAAESLVAMQAGYGRGRGPVSPELRKSISAWRSRPPIVLPPKGKKPKRPSRGKGV